MKNIFFDMDFTIVNSIELLVDGELGTQKYKTERGWFKKLKPYKNIELLNDLARNGNVWILSNSPTEQADFDKNWWLDMYIPNIPVTKRIFNRGAIAANKTKAQVAMEVLGRKLTVNDILFDDAIENCKDWEKAGGRAILKTTRIKNDCLNAGKVWNGETVARLSTIARRITAV